jgi:hypothetical protein
MIERTPVTRHVTAALARARGLGGLAGLAFGLAALGACLSVPAGPAPMCHVSADCDQMNGEVCEEGVCWGNPPPGPFAAVVSPPSTSHDLVPREIPAIAIPDFGWMGDLALEAPLPLNGKIVAFCATPAMGCDTTTLGATVAVSRHSQFRGGPGFKAVINVDAGADSFAIPVPRTRPGDEPYTVTIVPAGGQTPGTGPAEHVPPLRMQVSVMANAPASQIVLGGMNLPMLTGTLTNTLGQGISNYRVVALGRWDPAEAPSEVSSVSFTSATGAYAVILSDQLVGTVELVARPPADTIAPAIHIANIDATKSSQHNVTVPATLGTGTRVVVGPVTGVDHSGTISPVHGALVSVTGALVNTNTLISFAISDQQLTGDDGMVTLNLVDGAGLAGVYRLSIIPPASSSLGAVFDQKLVAATEQRLPSRVALRGTVVDHAGEPLGNVAITARPSLRFLWTLEAAPQAFVAAIPAATAVTLPTGEFVVWVDPNVANVWGNYDLLIEPPATAQAPTYTRSDVDIRRDGTLGLDGAPDSVSLDKIILPDAAYVHGRITGPEGTPVENAELKLYLVSTELSLCSQVAHAPASCPIPAQLQDRNTSNAEGTVRLALPR